jgi:hypothetical protein
VPARYRDRMTGARVVATEHRGRVGQTGCLGLLALVISVVGCSSARATARIPARARPLRVELATGCPQSVKGFDGPANPNISHLADRIVPRAATGGVVCRYNAVEGNDVPTVTPGALAGTASLSPQQADLLANDANAIPQGHGISNCPAGYGRFTIIAFEQASGPVVDVWLDDTGCGTVTNGRKWRGGINPQFGKLVSDLQARIPTGRIP